MAFRFKHFQSRLMVFFLTLLSIVLATVYFSVNSRNLENAMDIIVNDLEAGARNFEFTITQRNESLAISADALSADFPFKQVYASGDHSTILSAMENLLDRMVYADFMVLVSDSDRVIADTAHPDRQEVVPNWLPLIEDARALDRAGEYPESADVVIIDDRPYHLTVLPFMNPDIEAWIGMGFEIDQFFTTEFKNTVSAEVTVVFLSDDGTWRSNGSTLRPDAVDALLRGFTGEMHNSDTPTQVALLGEQFVTLTIPVVNQGNRVQVLLQRSLLEQLRPYEATRIALLTIFAIGLLVLLGGVVVISRNVTKPVKDLVRGAQRIEAGTFDENVTIEQEDELGRLAEAFNKMAKGLAEKEKVRDLLGKVVSPEIADELMSKKIELGGEARRVTMLFSDIRGFTTLCEGKSPVEILSLLNEYFTALTSVIEVNGGVVDKYIGDAVMALFGAPVAHADAAARAVNTALGMQAALAAVNREFIARGGNEIHIGVGINTDEVVVGNMGSKSRLNYTVIGDGVNLASRIEGLTKNYGVAIIVSESTVAEADEFVYQELDLVRVKGRKDPVRVFQPLDKALKEDGPTKQRLLHWSKFLRSYRSAEFEEATALLNGYRAAYSNMDSQLISLYDKRLQQIRANPPETWDGVYTYLEK